jgi:hypothetical protein
MLLLMTHLHTQGRQLTYERDTWIGQKCNVEQDWSAIAELDVGIQCDTVQVDVSILKMRHIAWHITSSNACASRIIS